MDSKPLQPVGLAWRLLRLCLFSVPLVAASCSRYPIAEAATARLAGELAIDAGATTYASSEYDRYLGSMDSAKQLLEQEQARRPWSRDYAPARQILTRAETEAEQALQTAVQMRDRYREGIVDDMRNIKEALAEIHSDDSRLSTQPAEAAPGRCSDT